MHSNSQHANDGNLYDKMLSSLKSKYDALNPRDSIKILLAEDDDDDYLLINEALEKTDLKFQLSRVENGEELIKYLSSDSPYQNAFTPHLILLDIKMPKKDGHETLKAIRVNPQHHNKVVIMLTTSKSEEDISTSYELGANSYIVKNSDLGMFSHSINSLLNYWFNVVELPSRLQT